VAAADCIDSDTAIAVQRLRQTTSAYSLRRIQVFRASAQLLPALGSATTLESVYIASQLPNDFKSQIALQLKAVPRLPEQKKDCLEASHRAKRLFLFSVFGVHSFCRRSFTIQFALS
jgi:hypothetical protein